jgi:predicted HicB family RNase H-like nuclease
MDKKKLWFGRAVRFSQEVDDLLMQTAKEQGVSVSQIIRQTCQDYLTQKKLPVR